VSTPFPSFFHLAFTIQAVHTGVSSQLSELLDTQLGFDESAVPVPLNLAIPVLELVPVRVALFVESVVLQEAQPAGQGLH
jgi:hypothetical protein